MAMNWRDYSASSNYAYEPFETDEALRAAAVMAANGTNGHTLVSTTTTGPAAAAAAASSRTVQRPASNASPSRTGDRSTYSLPRTQQGHAVSNGSHGSGQSGRPRTHSSTSIHQPDFYFMPSQRRYSGYAADYQ